MTLQARYTILRKVADGGTAEIFLATQHGAHGFEKTVVLKRIFPAFYADPQFRNMLVDEAHIAMSLNHSNIVQVLDLGETDGQYALALELVDGWSLDAVLRRARALKTSIPPPLALYMTAEVCRALAYAHAKSGADEKPLGIVHRDISPHNVLLSEQGEVKLTDFGIAKAHNRRESSVGNMIKGKIAYMSPEQASGGGIDARSDLFSVGTMLYVMVCRRYPFDAPTDLEVLLLVKNGEYEPPERAMPGLNPELYRVIRRAMAKSPEDRYQRAEEMLIDVEQVMRVAFRAVGQTELKRWLQDLSMRDGVPPLTRKPPAPTTESSGILEGETVELKGVGTTAPPAAAVSLPPPVSGKGPAPAPRGGGVTGKRPPPPPAAMSVGKKGVPSPLANTPASGATAGGTTPVARGLFTPGVPHPVPASPSARTRLPRETMPVTGTRAAGADTLPDDDQLGPTPLPLLPPSPTSRIAAAPHARPSGTPQTPGPAAMDEKAPTGSRMPGATGPTAAAAMEADAEAANAEKQLRRSGNFDPPPPALRKSSSWVAEAVLASAQRAGTTPAPPVNQVVVPPPVASMAAPEVIPDAAETTAPHAIEPTPPRRRALFWGGGAGVVTVLIVGMAMRRCGGTSEPSQVARDQQQHAKPAVAAVRPVVVPRSTPPVAPVLPVAAPPMERKPDPPAPAAATAAAARAAKPTAATDGATGPASGSAVVAVAPHATVPPLDGKSPPAGAVAEGAKDTPPRPNLAATPVPTDSESPSPPGGAAERGANSDNDSEADGGTNAAAVPKVSVFLSSNPPGAQVGTARRSFGSTPVAVKLRVGHTYAVVFSREGYRPVTKQFRVTKFPDQQVSAVLRRDQPTGKPEPISPVTPPATPKQNGSWFQRVFGR